MVTIRSSQKIFTEQEVCSLTGICLEHLRALARIRHLGYLIEAAQSAGEQAQRLFTASDLYIVTTLYPRCEH